MFNLFHCHHRYLVSPQNRHDLNFPVRFKESLERMQEVSKKFSLDLSGGRELLRASVKRISSHVEDIDSKGYIYHLHILTP
jgi:hypothetical protein